MTGVLLISLILLLTKHKIRRLVFLSGFVFPGLDIATVESEFVKAFRKFVNSVLSLNESEFLVTFDGEADSREMFLNITIHFLIFKN
jgi:uncharacterized membrane protein